MPTYDFERKTRYENVLVVRERRRPFRSAKTLIV
jgi:hypothetical protein